MEITEIEKEIIKEVIKKREAGKRKWAYLLYDIVEKKRIVGVPFDDIVEWLSKNGLTIKSEALRKIIWDYKNKIETQDKTVIPSSTSGSNIGKKVTTPSIVSEPISPDKYDISIDLSEELRKREKVLKNKNAGFDQFDNL